MEHFSHTSNEMLTISRSWVQGSQKDKKYNTFGILPASSRIPPGPIPEPSRRASKLRFWDSSGPDHRDHSGLSQNPPRTFPRTPPRTFPRFSRILPDPFPDSFIDTLLEHLVMLRVFCWGNLFDLHDTCAWTPNIVFRVPGLRYLGWGTWADDGKSWT